MANNGFGRDTVLLRQMIRESRLVPISPTDSYLMQYIKRKLNNVVEEDVVTKESYYLGGTKKYNYLSHSAWRRVKKTVTKINKLRQQNWFWEYITL